MKLIIRLLPLFLLLTACPPRITVPEEVPEEMEQVEDLPIGSATFQEWIHRPLHPGNQQQVIFSVKASDPQRISRVELAIYEYELFKNELGLPSKRKKANGVWGTVDSFEPEVPQQNINHAFTYTPGFGAHSNVEYIFSLFSLDGTVTREMALFDAGDSPWPKDKILLYATNRNVLEQSINLCFFPDTDYNQDWSGFLSDTEALIFKGYHTNNKIKDHKNRWSFFYTQQQTDGLALSNDPFNEDRYPDFMKDSMILGIDAFGLLHREPYSDGAYLNSNIQFLAQNVFTSESYNWGTAIHETAHSVFHLSDEYNGCVCFSSQGGSNIFQQQNSCEVFNENLGRDKEECTEIVAYDGKAWYLAEEPPLFEDLEACKAFNRENNLPVDSCRLFQDFTGSRSYQAYLGVCIMQDDGDGKVPDFRHACSAVIDRFYQDLLPPDTDPVDLVLMEAVDNFFTYEPVVILTLHFKAEAVEVEVEEVCYGVPTRKKRMATDISLRMAGSDQSTYQLSLDRPDCIHLHYGEGKAEVRSTTKETTFRIAIPMLEEMGDIVCEDYRYGKATREHAFDLQKEMLGKIKDFKQKIKN